MKNDSSLEFYLDTLVIQAAFGNEKLMKEAEEGVVDSLVSAIKSYIGDKIKPDDKIGSVINILGPGAITVMLQSLGLGWISFIVGVALEVFDVDIASLVRSALDKVISSVKEKGHVTTEEVKGAVESSFSPEINKEPSAQQAENFAKRTNSFTVRDAFLYRFGMEQAIKEYNITKNAGLFSLFSGGKKGTVTLLMKVISWIFRVVLTSAGLMAAGAAVKSVVGPQSSAPAAPPPSASKQTKFKVNTNYNNSQLNSATATWIESVKPTRPNIENFVLDWMSEVYEGTEKYENIASGTVGFRNVVEEIESFNSGNTSGRVTYIPKMFTTKKSAVDVFIDEVANKTPNQPGWTPNTPGKSIMV